MYGWNCKCIYGLFNLKKLKWKNDLGYKLWSLHILRGSQLIQFMKVMRLKVMNVKRLAICEMICFSWNAKRSTTYLKIICKLQEQRRKGTSFALGFFASASEGFWLLIIETFTWCPIMRV